MSTKPGAVSRWSRAATTRAASRPKSGCIDDWYAAVSAISSSTSRSLSHPACSPAATLAASAAGSTLGSRPTASAAYDARAYSSVLPGDQRSWAMPASTAGVK